MRRLTQVWQVLLLNVRQQMRSRSAFFFNLVFPLLMLLWWGWGNSGSGVITAVPVGLVDQDGGDVAQMIRAAVEQSGHFELVAGDEDELMRKLDGGAVRAVLVLPPGLSDQVAAGAGPGEVVIRWDPTSFASTATKGGLQSLVEALDPARRQPLLTVRSRPLDSTETLGAFDYLMPGVLVWMLLNAGIMAVGPQIAYQRREGTLRHMFSTPLSMGGWLAGTVLGLQALAVLQLLVLWGVGAVLFAVQLPRNLPGTLVILLLSSTAGVAIGLAIAACTRHADTAGPISIIVSTALSLLGGAILPVNQAPEPLQAVMQVLPSFHMTHALQQVMMKGHPLATVLPSLGVLALTAAVALGLAAWRLRRTVVTAV
mgnify:CR=1 FL=1